MGATVSELPSRGTVLPAELEVLELGLLITLLQSPGRTAMSEAK